MRSIAFSAVTAFEARCKSAAAPECRRASGWQVRWPADQALRLERAVPASQVEPTIIAERPLGVSIGTVFQPNSTAQTIHTP
jgi:hypothetical protein